MVGAAGVFMFTFGAWMSPYLHDSIINDSVKEARLTKVDALLTEGGTYFSTKYYTTPLVH